MMKHLRLHIFLLFSLLTSAFSAFPAQRELRGVWIATVSNIDWPYYRKDAAAQQKQMTALLDSLQAVNINAIFFQIRPSADALYQSDLEPWSYYLTGKQGTAPQPVYDPLQFVISEAHKRCMEVHAWLNPYRALNSNDTTQLDSKHIYHQMPQLFKRYGGKLYFDPGKQLTRDYLTMIVMDVALRYDIDAIHFDDYFYPYKVGGADFPDDDTYRQEGRGIRNKGDWRRDNNNQLICQIQTTLKAAKPWVEFGVSPFGRQEEDYSELYADVATWMQNGWIDYVAPQLYWPIGHRLSDFDRLYDWWGSKSHGCYKGKNYECNFYTGLYAAGLEIYTQKVWQTPNELTRQMRLSRAKGISKGEIFYSCHYLLHNPQGLMDSLRNNYYHQPALNPECQNLGGRRPETPLHTRLTGTTLVWDSVPGKDGEAISCYAVYLYHLDASRLMYGNPQLIAVTRNTSIDLNTLRRKYSMSNATVRITAINRYRKESEPSDAVNTNTITEK